MIQWEKLKESEKKKNKNVDNIEKMFVNSLQFIPMYFFSWNFYEWKQLFAIEHTCNCGGQYLTIMISGIWIKLEVFSKKF